MVATVEFEPQDHGYLDKKVKTQWLKALRSREYKQGHEYLKTSDGKYCCLGVLAELHGAKIIPDTQSFLDDQDAATLFHCGRDDARKIQETLANRNDGVRHEEITDSTYYGPPQKFYQIARWIERNL